MKRLSLPKVPFISKTVLLVGAGLLIFLAIVAFGVVRNVQAQNAEAAAVAAERAKQEAVAKQVVELKEQNAELAKALQFQTAKASSTCDWIRSVQPKYRFTVPPLCKQP